MDSVAETLSVGLFVVAMMCAVMFGRCVEVPAINGMEGPSARHIRFYVYLNFAPHWSQWHLVVVEVSVKVGIDGDCGRGIGLVEEVNGNFSLWKQFVPKFEWEVIGNTSEYAEEVVFEVPDGHFGCIAMMAPGWD